MATRNTTEEVRKKEQRTNEQYELGSTQNARKTSLWRCIPCAPVDYRWRVVLAKLLLATRNADSFLTVLLTTDRCRLILSFFLTDFSLTGLFCCPLSTDPLRQPSPTAFSWFLFPTALTGVPLPTAFARTCLFFPTSGHVEDLELRPFFGFAPKQTKRSSAWRPPHSVTLFLNILFYLIMFYFSW